MIPCEVEAVFAPNGNARPISLLWGGQVLRIVDTGRRWSDEVGQHILARAEDGRVFELLYNAANWQAQVVSQPPNFA